MKKASLLCWLRFVAAAFDGMGWRREWDGIIDELQVPAD